MMRSQGEEKEGFQWKREDEIERTRKKRFSKEKKGQD